MTAPIQAKKLVAERLPVLLAADKRCVLFQVWQMKLLLKLNDILFCLTIESILKAKLFNFILEKGEAV